MWEYIWGTIPSLGAFAESVGNMPNMSWFHLYEFMVLAGRKTNNSFLNSLTAMDGHDRPLNNELRARVVSP